NDYINRKNNQGILDLKKETEVNGLPANTVIIVRDETGKELRDNNFAEYYYSKSPEEQAELARLSAINNELGSKLSNAKTSEEKKKLEKELEQNQQAMNAIVYSKMTYNEYYTGKSLVESALSYKDGVLVVDKNKMLGEVEKADTAKGMEVGRIEGGVSQQTVQDIKNKYGTSSISGSDTIPKDDVFTEYNVNDSMATKIVNQNRRDEFLSQVENKKLRNLIESDYRENGSVNDGGVATVIGLDVGESDHIKKSRDLYDAYRKVLNQSDKAKLNIKNAAKAGNDISKLYENKDIILNEREEKVIKELIENLRNGRANFFNN
ncbi:MAG: hypothetical protein LBV03_01170, partial [Fusobacteriales bacterium]|nr:hypothetical protein [Fusobacteriales bacterium]